MGSRLLREAAAEWRPGSPEAQLLAQNLRNRRLTIALGSSRDELTSLLAAGVLPLLGRRTEDTTETAVGGAAGVVIPFRDRRHVAYDRQVEILVLFDAASERSLDLLETRFDVSLRAAGLRAEGGRRRLTHQVLALSERYPGRFLFVVDGFDALLPSALGRSGAEPLVDELASLLNSPCAAHVLLTVRSGFEQPLQAFLDRLHGVEPVWVDLCGKPPAFPRLSVAFSHGAAVDSAPADSPPPFDTPPPGRPRRVDMRRWATPALIACAAAVAVTVSALPLLWGPQRSPDEPRAPAPRAEAAAQTLPVFTPTAPLAPALELLIEGESDVPSRVATELAIALGRDGGLSVRPRVTRSVAATLASAAAVEPHLAIVRYDVLKAALGTPERPPVVIAPLFTEEVFVVVSARSRLRHLHELKRQRINVGPAAGGRAVTANTLYRKMFAEAPVPAAAGPLDAAAALRLLADDGAIDAVLLVGPPGRALLSGLPSGRRAALKLLELAPDHPASRRALQSYLPGSATSPSGEAVASLASLDFLVAFGPGGPAHEKTLAQVASALCSRLGGLQRDGDRKWREVQPGLQLPAWPQRQPPGLAETTWAQCPSTATATATASISLPPKPGVRE